MPSKLIRWSGQYQLVTTVTDFPPSIDVQTYVLSFTENRTGVSNPKWKSQVRNHQNATTPYNCDRLTVEVGHGSSLVGRNIGNPADGKVRVWSRSGWMLQSITIPSLGSSSSAVEDRALVAFIKKARKEQQSMQSIVSLGELREAIHMIRHPAESLKRALESYVRTVPSIAARRVNRQRGMSTPRTVSRKKILAQAVSGTYLEYANGWSPFVRDIVAASKTVAEHFNPSGIGYRKVSASAESTEYITPVPFNTGWGEFSWRQNELETRNTSSRIIGEVVVSNSGSPEDLLRNSGFTLREFVPSIYELLPLSYVADWFLNIGDVLEAYAFNWASVGWRCRTTRNKSVRTHAGQAIPLATPGGFNGYFTYSGNPGSVVITRTGLSRSDLPVTMPSLAFSLPGTHLFSKLANVTSLLTQARLSSRQLGRLLNG